MELLTGSRCCAWKPAFLVMDSYCKDNKFHLTPVAADNTWQVQNNQVAEKEKREQILYKCATVYYVGLHMTNATIKAEPQ